jgi:hypothetical protein
VVYAVRLRPELLAQRSFAFLLLASYLTVLGARLPRRDGELATNRSAAGPESQEVDDTGQRIVRVGALIVYEAVLGFGSHGTVVFLGGLNGRPVAVKRMLAQFLRAADRYGALLIA